MDSNEVRQLLLAKHALLKKKDYFALLDLDESASAEDVKGAYFRLVKLLHPDRIARSEVKDLLAQATEVFRTLTTAYNTLSDTAARNAYVGSRRTDSGESSEGGEEAVSEDARIFRHRGELMLKRRAYAEAEDFFQRALEFTKDDPTLLMKLGMAVFENPAYADEDRLERARGYWERAEKLSENRGDALYHLALYWKAKGDMDRVEEHLRDVLHYQPNHVEAKREMRLLLMRRKRQREEASFFGRLKAVLTRKL